MISFIILHYKNFDITIDCLKSIKKIMSTNDSIIVIDNNTLDKDEKNKLFKYTKDIISLDNNYGYAKGNNIGIKYAKEKYNSDFYVVINNDVIIEQIDFEKRIKEDYKKYHFDMLGTRINSSSGESVNPFPVLKDKNEVISEINKCKKLCKIYKSVFLSFLLNIFFTIKYTFRKREVSINGDMLMKNVALHGCGIIFSKKYVKKYKFPFYNETFLFHEEEFLFQRIIRDKLISIYDPNIEIFHKEGSSVGISRKSKLFKTTERIKSLELLLKVMESKNEG